MWLCETVTGTRCSLEKHTNALRSQHNNLCFQIFNFGPWARLVSTTICKYMYICRIKLFWEELSTSQRSIQMKWCADLHFQGSQDCYDPSQMVCATPTMSTTKATTTTTFPRIVGILRFCRGHEFRREWDWRSHGRRLRRHHRRLSTADCLSFLRILHTESSRYRVGPTATSTDGGDDRITIHLIDRNDETAIFELASGNRFIIDSDITSSNLKSIKS